jgi:hypothetical protein
MRSIGIFGTALAMGLSLAACTGQDGASGEGRVARQAGSAAQAATWPSPAATAGRKRFAALPDRGGLLRYDAQAALAEGAYTWHRTELSEQHALDAIHGGTLRVQTPNGSLLGFQYDRSIRHDETGDWTWIGHLPGQEGVQAIITFGAGAVYGSIGQPDARPLRLAMRGGSSWLVETDPSRLAGLASHAANPVSPDYRIVSPAALQRVLASRPRTAVKSAGLAPHAAAVAATTTVDVVIGYTQGFANAQGGGANAVTRLNSLVDTANAGLANSKVDGRIRLVHTLQVNYTDTNTNDAALGQLTGYDSDNQRQTTPNAAFNALRSAREQYGADLVSLVRPFKDPEQDSCGIAWLVGGGKQTVTATNGWDYFGYSVVSDGSDKNESDGKTYYCEEHTLAHELGHNMGSAHDRATQMSDDGKLDDPDDYGAFAYSFGYKPTTAGKNFYTIMAYGDSGQTPYLVFSNPRITFCGGNACGVNNSEDNAKSLGLVMPPVSGFRATVVSGGGNDSPMPVARRLDANGNARADLFFFNHATGKLVTWFMSGTNRTAYASSSIPGSYSLVGAGAFNADSKDDLLLAGSATTLFIGMSNGTTFALQPVSTAVPAGSQALDVADIDGNGKADIVVRNASTGQVVVWYMTNGVRTAYKSTAFSPTLTYVLAADFNNDRKADLLFQDAQRNLSIAISSGSGFTLQPVGLAYASSYALRGATDVSGDGSADILLHDAATNKLVVWYMHGATRAAYNSMTGPAGAALVAHGDFDGNKKSDVGWAHPTNGRIWLSLSNGSAFTTTQLAYAYTSSTGDPMDIAL